MAEKRRGLGRGLGALIPAATEPVSGSQRPVDVFFPHQDATSDTEAEQSAVRHTGGAGLARGGKARSGAAKSVGPVEPAARMAEAKAAAKAGVKPATARSLASKPAARSKPASKAKRKAKTSAEEAALAASTGSAEGTAAGAVASPASAASKTAAGTQAVSGVIATTSAAAAAPVRAVHQQATAQGDTAERPDGGQGPGLVPVPGVTFAELPVGVIRANARQPRQVFDEEAMLELVQSIKQVGVLQPVVVRPIAEADISEDGVRFELVMGERRWRATRRAGLAVVPTIVRHTNDADLLRDALLENLHRSELNPLEEAAAYEQLLADFACTHDELASRIGRSRPQISNMIRLLKLPSSVQSLVAEGTLSAGHARALLGLSKATDMERIAEKVVEQGLSVRATEHLVAVAEQDNASKSSRRRPPQNAELTSRASRLSSTFDTQVGITMGKKKGKVTIEFAGMEDLDRIMEMLVRNKK